jgi:hypothetical protein
MDGAVPGAMGPDRRYGGALAASAEGWILGAG